MTNENITDLIIKEHKLIYKWPTTFLVDKTKHRRQKVTDKVMSCSEVVVCSAE